MTLIYSEEGHKSPLYWDKAYETLGTVMALGPSSSPHSCTLKALLWLFLVLLAGSMVGVYREE